MFIFNHLWKTLIVYNSRSGLKLGKITHYTIKQEHFSPIFSLGGRQTAMRNYRLNIIKYKSQKANVYYEEIPIKI